MQLRSICLMVVLVGCGVPDVPSVTREPISIAVTGPSCLMEATVGAMDYWNAELGYTAFVGAPSGVISVLWDPDMVGFAGHAANFTGYSVVRVATCEYDTTRIVAHELGHVLALPDLSDDSDSLMYASVWGGYWLSEGERDTAYSASYRFR